MWYGIAIKFVLCIISRVSARVSGRCVRVVWLSVCCLWITDDQLTNIRLKIASQINTIRWAHWGWNWLHAWISHVQTTAKKVIHEIAVDKSYWLWQTWKKKKNNKIVEMINWRLCGYNRWKLYPTTYTQTQSNQPKHLLDNRHFFAGSISGSLPLLWPLQTSQFYRKIHSSKIWTDSFNIDNR